MSTRLTGKDRQISNYLTVTHRPDGTTTLTVADWGNSATITVHTAELWHAIAKDEDDQ